MQLAHAGETFELGGPEVYTMAALNRWIAARTGRDPLLCRTA
jgi:uncharacterized protein YbjT (DUF2867 family)